MKLLLLLSALAVLQSANAFISQRPVSRSVSQLKSHGLTSPSKSLSTRTVSLQMSSGAAPTSSPAPNNRVLAIVKNCYAKFLSLVMLILSPLRFLVSLLERLVQVGKKTVISTTSPAKLDAEKVTSMGGVGSIPSLSLAAISNKMKRSKAEAEARNYISEKIRQIEESEEETRKLKAGETGRWPPNIVTPPKIGSAKNKKSLAALQDFQLRGKRVLVRCDLNVPLKDGQVTDDTRIRGCIPTIKYLVKKGARVMLVSHLGRPKKAQAVAGGGYESEYDISPVLPRLSELLGQQVPLVKDMIGPSVYKAVNGMKNGQVVLLQNSRFHKGEEENCKDLALALSKNVDVFVNDAFGTAHRAHATTAGITTFVRDNVAGFLLQKELDYLQGAVDVPKRPFAAIVGGSKVSSKISVIEAMLGKVDKLILGGGMVFTFLKARGVNVGASLVEDDQLELARRLEQLAKDKGVEIFLADDVVVADKFAADANIKIVSVNDIPEGWMGLDIGPETLANVNKGLSDCKTVIWNGPMGVFEMDAFSKGTFGVAETLAGLTNKGCVTIIGGGDSVAAVEKAGLASKMSHISTGGGASLELLEGLVLPGVEALDDA